MKNRKYATLCKNGYLYLKKGMQCQLVIELIIQLMLWIDFEVLIGCYSIVRPGQPGDRLNFSWFGQIWPDGGYWRCPVAPSADEHA